MNDIVKRMVAAARGHREIDVALLRAGFTTAEIIEYYPEVAASLQQEQSCGMSRDAA